MVSKIIKQASLRRYLDTFQQRGLLLARDLTHLDHHALVSLGVTATGHRKRILRLVSHVARTEGAPAHPTQRVLTRNRCQSVTEWRRSAGPGPPQFEVFRNSSTPDLAVMLTNFDGDKPIEKPVPKPRTVFNRRRTVPVRFCPDLDAMPQTPRRRSQDYPRFQGLEGLSSLSGPSTDDSSEPRRNQAAGRRPNRSLSLSAPGQVLPPVPPRMTCGGRPSGDKGSSSSSSPAPVEQKVTCSVAPSPGNRLSGSTPSGSPSASRMEMVSNEIYWGTLPGSVGSPGAGMCSRAHTGPPTPPRQTAGPQRNR